VGVSLGVIVLDGVRDELELAEPLIVSVRDGLGVSVAEELGVSECVSVGVGLLEFVLLIEDE